MTFHFILEDAGLNLTLDLKAITEINKQAGEDVDLIASRVSSEDLSVKAKAVIGTRPVFDLKAVYGGKAAAISNFGVGTVK